MKITQLASKPKLIKLELTDEEIIKEYGEALEFWIWDRQPMAQFVKLASTGQENYEELVQVVEGMILDEEGHSVVKDGVLLPTMVMAKVVGKVVEVLGK